MGVLKRTKKRVKNPVIKSTKKRPSLFREFYTQSEKTDSQYRIMLGYLEKVNWIEKLYNQSNPDSDLDLSIDHKGQNALHRACEAGDDDLIVLKFLRSGKFGINAKDYSNNSYFHITNNIKIAELLLLAGCRADAVNSNGYNALHKAAETGNLEICRLLVKANRKLLYQQDLRGFYPIHMAVSEGHTEIVEYFLSVNPALAHAKDFSGLIPLFYCKDAKTAAVLFTSYDDKKDRDRNGWHPIHMAAYRGYDEMVNFHLEKGTDANCTASTDGSTPLHWLASNFYVAARVKGQPRFEKCFNLLKVAGANLEAVTTNQSTPLHYAIGRGNKAGIKFLIQHGAKTNNLQQQQSNALPLDSSGMIALQQANISLNREETLAYVKKVVAKKQAQNPILNITPITREESIPAASRQESEEEVKVRIEIGGQIEPVSSLALNSGATQDTLDETSSSTEQTIPENKMFQIAPQNTAPQPMVPEPNAADMVPEPNADMVPKQNEVQSKGTEVEDSESASSEKMEKDVEVPSGAEAQESSPILIANKDEPSTSELQQKEEDMALNLQDIPNEAVPLEINHILGLSEVCESRLKKLNVIYDQIVGGMLKPSLFGHAYIIPDNNNLTTGTGKDIFEIVGAANETLESSLIRNTNTCLEDCEKTINDAYKKVYDRIKRSCDEYMHSPLPTFFGTTTVSYNQYRTWLDDLKKMPPIKVPQEAPKKNS